MCLIFSSTSGHMWCFYYWLSPKNVCDVCTTGSHLKTYVLFTFSSNKVFSCQWIAGLIFCVLQYLHCGLDGHVILWSVSFVFWPGSYFVLWSKWSFCSVIHVVNSVYRWGSGFPTIPDLSILQPHFKICF